MLAARAKGPVVAYFLAKVRKKRESGFILGRVEKFSQAARNLRVTDESDKTRIFQIRQCKKSAI